MRHSDGGKRRCHKRYRRRSRPPFTDHLHGYRNIRRGKAFRHAVIELSDHVLGQSFCFCYCSIFTDQGYSEIIGFENGFADGFQIFGQCSQHIVIEFIPDFFDGFQLMNAAPRFVQSAG